MYRWKLGLSAALFVCALAAAVTTVSVRSVRGPASLTPDPNLQPAEPEAPALITAALPIRQGDNLEALLQRGEVEREDRIALISSLQGVFDVRKFRAGTELVLARSEEGAIEHLEYVIDPDRRLRSSRNGSGFDAAIVEVPGTVSVAPVCGTLQGSLFWSVDRAGAPAELALDFAQVFAWDIDFYTDPQPGDEFCFLVERKDYDNGQPPTFKRIVAAQYRNAGTLHEGFAYPDTDGKPRFYSRDGRSLQAAFLRSPLKFEARVTSRFSRSRFHPVLKIRRPHLGTDYAAPVGSPVQTIAPGRVIFSGYQGQAGHLVTIQHPGGYESMYMHLSRRNVKVGDRVEQGQTIGAVGSTGLSTGPHLDFRLRKNGQYVDFERIKPPRMTRIPEDRMAAFGTIRDDLTAQIDLGRRDAFPVYAGSENGSTRQVD
jgi:murein DD-endopeptidase MepM/ murein hydrolase activator NlpD